MTMHINEDGKYTTPVSYFYNPYINMYCLVGSTIAVEYLDDLVALFESPDLLSEIDLPEYITDENYDAPEW